QHEITDTVDLLEAALRAATIEVSRVPVVALLARLADAVAADLGLAGGVAAGAAGGLARLALGRVDAAVSARAGHAQAAGRAQAGAARRASGQGAAHGALLSELAIDDDGVARLRAVAGILVDA